MPSQKHFKGPINLPKDFVLIRSLGLDEMPQLLLILLGKMSWIGPRPLLPEYLNLYNSEQLKRHDCRPGIIGLAQLKGATRISWRHRLQYDIFYVDHLSLALDLKLLFLYLKSVGRLRDASVYNEPYNGKN